VEEEGGSVGRRGESVRSRKREDVGRRTGKGGEVGRGGEGLGR
jgi:hypothetical protein